MRRTMSKTTARPLSLLRIGRRLLDDCAAGRQFHRDPALRDAIAAAPSAGMRHGRSRPQRALPGHVVREQAAAARGRRPRDENFQKNTEGIRNPLLTLRSRPSLTRPARDRRQMGTTCQRAAVPKLRYPPGRDDAIAHRGLISRVSGYAHAMPGYQRAAQHHPESGDAGHRIGRAYHRTGADAGNEASPRFPARPPVLGRPRARLGAEAEPDG